MPVSKFFISQFVSAPDSSVARVRYTESWLDVQKGVRVGYGEGALLGLGDIVGAHANVTLSGSSLV